MNESELPKGAPHPDTGWEVLSEQVLSGSCWWLCCSHPSFFFFSQFSSLLLFLPFCSFTILPVPTLSLSDSFPHMTHLQGSPELKHEVREFVLGSHSFFVSFIHTPPHCQQHLPYPPSDHRFLAGEKLLDSRKYWAPLSPSETCIWIVAPSSHFTSP